jgi:amino acid adenylation domain-containing protein
VQTALATTGFRLSPQQTALWAAQVETPVLQAFGSVSLTGPLDAGDLRAAVESAAQRHEILRTTFQRRTGMLVPLQVVGDTAGCDWRTVDLRGRGGEQSAALDELGLSERVRPFDLEHGPLLRAVLIALDAHQHVLSLTLPTLCADASSIQILFDEIRSTYAGLGTSNLTGEPPLQYADYSEWRSQVLEANDDQSAAGKAFWSQTTVDDPAPFTVLYQKRTPAGAAFAPESHTVTVPPDLAGAAVALAAREGTTLAAILLACWEVTLVRLSGGRTCPVRVVADGRDQEPLLGAVGLFAQALPIACEVDNPPFRELLGRIQGSLDAVVNWQNYHVAAVGTLGIDFEFADDSARAPQDARGLTFAIEESSCHLERFLLKLSCRRLPDACLLKLWFDSGSYEVADIKRIAAYLLRLLEGVTRAPGSVVRAVDILDPQERHELVAAANQTREDQRSDRCVHELFEAQVERTPDRVALVFEKQRFTYRELNEQSNALAHYLRELGVDRGVAVGLCVTRSPEMIIGLLAIIKAGGAYVPLDPESPQARLKHQIEHAGVRTILAQAGSMGALPTFGGDVLRLDADRERWAAQPVCNLAAGVISDDVVYVIFTSGSTGLSKGVAVRHRNLASYAQFITRKLLAEDEPEGFQFATVSTISADLGNTAIFPALISGGGLHVIPYETATDAGRFAAQMATSPVDVLKITPSHLSALILDGEVRAIVPRRYLVLGGEALSWDLVRRVSEAASCRVINHYGPTETTVGSLTFDAWSPRPVDHDSATVPIGRPIANTAVYIVDSEGQPVPKGVPGELWIGGAGVAAGYVNQPEQTAERFVDDPFASAPGARLYRTGDRARHLPDGQVEFLGRFDDQVKIRGFRVEPNEVVRVIECHPSIARAVVIAKDDSSRGKVLVAYLVGRPGIKPEIEALRHFLLEQLPPYMVPAFYVVLDHIPLTPNGKVDTHALPEPNELLGQSATQSYHAPRNATETQLAGIWESVLGVERVGIHDNFFDLGGHSLLATQVISRVRGAFGTEIALRSLFETPTVAGLAVAIASCQPRVASEDDEVTRLLTDLEGLSEEEVQRLLASELGGQ